MLARITIEQMGPDRWVAEVEAGGLRPDWPAFRKFDAGHNDMRASTFGEIMDKVARCYFMQVPPEVGHAEVEVDPDNAKRVFEVPHMHGETVDEHDRPLPGTVAAERMSAEIDAEERRKEAAAPASMDELVNGPHEAEVEPRVHEEIAGEPDRPMMPEAEWQKKHEMQTFADERLTHEEREADPHPPAEGEADAPAERLVPRMPLYDEIAAHTEAEPPAADPAADEPEEEHDEATREELRTEATALGIDVDGRWGVRRLHQEIDRAKAKTRQSWRGL